MEKRTYNIKEYLQLRDYGVKEFADEMGCHPTTISNYIHRRRKPSLEMMCLIHRKTKGKVTAEKLLEYWEAKKDHG